ncbi:MAG: ABC-F family ATP-binding cassette domain-containing protein [Patescibacteria group bacterium]|nr:ABC-F family ATP-binding cassette domain-containing protein [Patescibacteria group bacterium]
MQILLSTKNIGFELPHKTLFRALSVTIARGDHIGLIGRNGEGKTSLLKILAGAVPPSSGRVESFGKVHYLPQLEFSLFERAETVEALLESRGVSWALVHASIERLFGTTGILPDKEVRALSGGELAKLLIATADTDSPDVLLLDEPTNHLDADGLEVLKRYLLAFRGAFVVVSHDPLFLDHVVSSLWELEGGILTRFGGNYSAYQEQKHLADEARERHLEAAKKDIRKARQAIEARETRAARAARAGRRSKAEPSRDKFAEGFFKGRSEKGAGRLKRQQDQMMEERQEKARQLQRPRRKTVQVGIAAGAERSKRMLVSVSDGSLVVAGRTLVDAINLRIEFGDRLVLMGKNGSGKSSLAKALVGIPGAYVLTGSVKRSDTFEAVYMDQKYQTVRPELSILDNLLQANPSMNEQAARGQLGTFLFCVETSIHKTADTLSGGETARLALAQATSRPIDLLVLDEPTNNLDIETLDTITDALEDFPGAMMVISHNVHFLARLGIERAYILSGGRLKNMRTIPEDEEEFYKELTTWES